MSISPVIFTGEHRRRRRPEYSQINPRYFNNISGTTQTSPKSEVEFEYSQTANYVKPAGDRKTDKTGVSNPLFEFGASVVDGFGSAKDNFVASRDYSKAAKFNVLYQDIMNVYKTVLSFRKQMAQLAEIRETSIDDYYIAQSDFASFLAKNNTHRGIAKIDNDKKMLFDTKNGFVMYGYQSDKSGFGATQINMLSPEKIKAPFANFAKILDKPVTLNNAYVSNDGVIQADSMVVYEFDEIDRLWSTKTYLNPTITYINDSSNDVVFRIDADAAFDLAFSEENYDKTIYLKNLFEEYTLDDCEIFADYALGRKNTGVEVYYYNYNEYLGSVGYDKKHVLDLSDM